MTDLDTLKALLDTAGIEYKLVPREFTQELSVERGYSGFVTVFVFTHKGKLKDMGAWE